MTLFNVVMIENKHFQILLNIISHNNVYFFRVVFNMKSALIIYRDKFEKLIIMHFLQSKLIY